MRALTPETDSTLGLDGLPRRPVQDAAPLSGSDERAFFRGVDTLAAVDIPPSRLLVYMLICNDRRETWDRVLHGFHRRADIGIRPFPSSSALAARSRQRRSAAPEQGTSRPTHHRQNTRIGLTREADRDFDRATASALIRIGGCRATPLNAKLNAST